MNTVDSIMQLAEILRTAATRSQQDEARAALHAALQEFAAERVVEPVAWRYDIATYLEGDVRGRGWRQTFSAQKPNMPWLTRDVTPLYTAPQPAQPAPDCRTCRFYAQLQGCWRAVMCTNGDQYQPAPKVGLWRTE